MAKKTTKRKATAKARSTKPAGAVSRKRAVKKKTTKKKPVARKVAARKKAAAKRAVGRPSKYTPNLGDRICAWIAEGNSATEACRRAEINRDTLYAWLREHSEFSDNYARAREDAADALVDDLREIEDNELDTQRARLKCDNRKWAAARMSPRKWGDRQALEHTGKAGAPLDRDVKIFVIPGRRTPAHDAEIARLEAEEPDE